MFSKIFIERPRFAMVISIVFVLMGIMAVTQLPIAEYPEIAPPQISVSTNYGGASAGVVAETVAIPIEDELNGVDDLLYFSSTCDNLGNYSCSVTFTPTRFTSSGSLGSARLSAFCTLTIAIS